MLNEKFLRPFDPAAVEETLYQAWETSGFFNPDTCVAKGIADKNAEPFSIVLPPPNVTGTLHMGHAAMLAVEDILVRYARMRGKRTLWIPGTDSAAIATQSKVESELYKKENKTRHDLGREAFLERVHAFAEASKNTIITQTKKMGASLDWSRYAFTLDETRYKAVMTAFKRMYDAGIIYRGARIVNWDPKMQTTVSDDEIEHVEQTDQFYYLKYGPFVIGTARPETKFGDKYVVMHPDDERYKDYVHGKQIELEWINGPITATIIKDQSVDMTFGTGVMTITPWHDATDFDIAQRHNLEREQIIDERGLLLPIAGEFAGMHIKKARAAIIEKLKQKGLVVRIEEPYVHNVATNSRGGGVIEPQIKEQWFIDVHKEFTVTQSRIEGIQVGDRVTLKTIMRQVVDNGSVTMYPERFQRIYRHWVDNLHDWCISRQIWYGHRIPVWYKGDQVYCDVHPPADEGWTQDPDTLDTWFSSGLWTFSTLGWPEETDDLKTYHPTSVLETGYDILPFWVARMILMSTFLRGEKPFTSVYFHGLVRDEKNRKMSKSLGNIVDPLDMIAKYGADAVRLSLIIGAAPGNDVPLSEHKTKGYKHFANKLWNVARYIFTATDGVAFNPSWKPEAKTSDAALVARRDALLTEVSNDIEAFRLHLAAEKLYHYAWHEIADVVIEESKPIFAGSDTKKQASRAQFLLHTLRSLLLSLHPFMPFVTEAIWQGSPFVRPERPFLMVESWVKTDANPQTIEN